MKEGKKKNSNTIWNETERNKEMKKKRIENQGKSIQERIKREIKQNEIKKNESRIYLQINNEKNQW